MDLAWTETDARLEFQRCALVMGGLLQEAQTATGDPLGSYACILSQAPAQERVRLQIWRRADLPSGLREMVEMVRPRRAEHCRLALLLRALDGKLWIMWPRVVVTVPGGNA